MQNNQQKEKRYKINTNQLLTRGITLLAIIIVIVLGLRFVLSLIPTYDDSILGSEYTPNEMPVPTATPAPKPTMPPNFVERTSPYAAEFISIYNQYEQKIAYLTFDDGPTAKITPQILDILKEQDVKASFFVLGKHVANNPDLAKRIVDEGHILANHSYSHDYASLYNGTDFFAEDIKKTEQIIIDTVGENGYVKVFRFPGGSFEKSKDPQKEKLSELGYVFLDWNALNGDAEGHNVAPATLLKKVQNTTKNTTNAVILMHDASTKQTTVDALPSIIEHLRNEGFVFKTLKDAMAN